MATQRINQGEHVAKIADEKGFASHLTIWDHSENRSLKALRRNPNVLFPGDELFVPEKESRTESGATEQRHKFVRKSTLLMLRLLVRNVDGTPARSKDCELIVNLERIPLMTDNDGKLEHQIPIPLEEAKLIIAEMDLEFDLKIGHLDPVETVSGVRARLNNMGYFAGYSQENETQLKWAVEEFQFENGLTPTGIVDDKTKSKLEKTYGV